MKDDHPFIMIPGAILNRDDLSLAEKIVFGCIHSATMGTAHKCFLTNEELSRRTAIHVNHVRRSLASLEKLRLIKRRYSKDHHRSKIDVIWKGRSLIMADPCVEGARKLLQGGAQEMAGGAQDVAPPATICCTPAPLDITADNSPPLPPPKRGGGADGGLVDRIKRRFDNVSDEKARDAIAVFGAKWVDLALSEADRHKAKRWNYCLAVLKGWEESGGPPEPRRRREPKRPCDEPYDGPPPPAPDAIPPVEAGARIREIMAGADTSQAKSAT